MSASLARIPDQTVPWTDKLLADVSRGPGGLAGAVRRIEFVIGPFSGRRGVFQLLLYRDPNAELNRREAFRVWLLIAALGDDPATWHVPDDVVPFAFDRGYLRSELARLCAAGDSNPKPAGLTFVNFSVRIAP